jgi:hypothetical protein
MKGELPLCHKTINANGKKQIRNVRTVPDNVKVGKSVLNQTNLKNLTTKCTKNIQSALARSAVPSFLSFFLL